MIPLPNLGFGFTSTTSQGPVQGTFQGNTAGGLTFGNRTTAPPIATYLMYGAIALGIFLIARKVMK